jgi:hypothetical protein
LASAPCRSPWRARIRFLRCLPIDSGRSWEETVASYWKQFCGNLTRHYYVLLYKHDPISTTKRPSVLLARLEVLGLSAPRVRVGESLRVTLKVTNLGDTRWLATDGDGWTRIGAHLFRADDPEPLDFDWCRAPLTADVPPGGRQRVSLTLPPLKQAGRYRVCLDLVIERRAWFADHGSPALDLFVHVSQGTRIPDSVESAESVD